MALKWVNTTCSFTEMFVISRQHPSTVSMPNDTLTVIATSSIMPPGGTENTYETLGSYESVEPVYAVPIGDD